jgi:hypothetical protein
MIMDWYYGCYVSILLTEKIYFSYFIEMQMIDDFLLNRRYVNMYALNVLSSFNYVEISLMLWNDPWMKGFELI